MVVGDFVYVFFEAGVTVKQIMFMMLPICIMTDAVMETVGLNLGVYEYYGYQPYTLFLFPYWWGFINAASFITVGYLIWVLEPRLKGAQRLALLFVAPTGMMIAYFSTGWPHLLAHNSTMPEWGRFIFATITMAACAGLVRIIAVAVAVPEPTMNWTFGRMGSRQQARPPGGHGGGVHGMVVQPAGHSAVVAVEDVENGLDRVRRGTQGVGECGGQGGEVDAGHVQAAHQPRHRIGGARVVRDNRLPGDAGHAQQQRDEDPGAVLTGRTVHEHRSGRGGDDVEHHRQHRDRPPQHARVQRAQPVVLAGPVVAECGWTGVVQQWQGEHHGDARAEGVRLRPLRARPQIEDYGRRPRRGIWRQVARSRSVAAVEDTGPGDPGVLGGQPTEIAKVGKPGDIVHIRAGAGHRPPG